MTAPATQTRMDDGGPLVPVPYRVLARSQEADDVVTLSMEPLEGVAPGFRAGQFNMLTAFGVGEAPVSISSAPHAPGPVEHTVRDVGAVTHALSAVPVGGVVGVRGPFGTEWGVDELRADDVVVVAGGIGLATLRGAISGLLEQDGRHPTTAPLAQPRTVTGRRRRVLALIGMRAPDQILFAKDIETWRRHGGEVHVTVDVADPSWTGPVGVVTTLLSAERFDPERTSALVCGPEVMIRFTARGLIDKDVAPERIRVSLERNMQCGVGWCGHCQLGPLLVCRDGPIVTYGTVERLLSEHER